MTGILGKKIGMTNIFDEEGRFIPVTLVEAGPCFVLGTKTKENAGYNAVILGYGGRKPKKTNRAQRAWFDKLKISPKRCVREFRTDGAPAFKVGDKIGVGLFKSGDYVDISGRTIGKGFQGGMKRWGWHGGEKGHGSMFHRAPGSIGASSFPSRVHKGKTMPGHMGSVMRCAQSLKVVSVDEDKNTLAIKGSIPGHRGSFVIVMYAKKRPPVKGAGEDGKKKKDEGKK